MEIIISICLFVCILFMLISLFSGVVALFQHKKNELIIFLRDYKKLRFMYIYIALFALNLAGRLFDEQAFTFGGLLKALKSTVEGAVLKFDFATFEGLYNSSQVWKIVIYLLVILVFINTILVVCSLFYIQAWKFTKLVSVKFKKENVVIIGYNDNSKKLINSINKKKYSVVVVDDFKGNYDELMMLGTAFIDTDIEQSVNVRKAIYSLLRKYNTEQCYFIVNTKDEKKNLIITNELSKIIERDEKRKQEIVENYVFNINSKIIKIVDVGAYEKIIKIKKDKKLSKEVKREEIRKINEDLKPKIDSYITKQGEDFKENLDNKIYQKEISISSKNITVYVIGTEENESAFSRFEKLTDGRIKYINRHRHVAYNFIERYPLTKFMDEDHIDYETGTLKNNVDINVYLIGYGATNQQILLASVANNQFLTIEKENDKKVVKNKLVNYYVYNNSDNIGKNMNHQYHRFEYEANFFKGREDEFYDEPIKVKPAEINLRPKTDINSKEFYSKLQEDVKKTKKEDINYIIISIGNEIENIDFAEKLTSKVNEWDVSGNTYIFVRISDSSVEENYAREKLNYKEQKQYTGSVEINGIVLSHNEEVKNEKNNDKKKYYFFGETDKIVFNFNSLIKQELYSVSRKRNAAYEIEKKINAKYEKLDNEEKKKYNLKTTAQKQKREQHYLTKSWYAKSQIERNSNLFAILSIRTKLNLLGYDLLKPDNVDDYESVSKNTNQNDSENKKVSFDEFYNKYFTEEERKVKFTYRYTNEKNKIFDKKIYQHGLEYPDTKRTYMAMQEHMRWTAFMLCMGMIPSTKKEVIEDVNNGKDYLVRRKHGCITTFEGLMKHRRVMAIKDGIKDYIKNNVKDINISNDIDGYCNEFFKNQFEDCERIFNSFSEEEQVKYLMDADTIRYDFQILDDLEFLFELCQYKIVKKNNNQ